MVIEEISAYAETDLLCYRAEGSEPLVRRQAETWQPVLDWLAETHRADLRVTAGIVHVAQSPEAVARIREVVSAHRDFELAALHQLTTSMGSIVLALAVSGGHLDAAAAVAAAHLDDSYQAEVWGEDSEAAARLTQIELELAVAERYLRLCRDEEG